MLTTDFHEKWKNILPPLSLNPVLIFRSTRDGLGLSRESIPPGSAGSFERKYQLLMCLAFFYFLACGLAMHFSIEYALSLRLDLGGSRGFKGHGVYESHH